MRARRVGPGLPPAPSSRPEKSTMTSRLASSWLDSASSLLEIGTQRGAAEVVELLEQHLAIALDGVQGVAQVVAQPLLDVAIGLAGLLVRRRAAVQEALDELEQDLGRRSGSARDPGATSSSPSRRASSRRMSA